STGSVLVERTGVKSLRIPGGELCPVPHSVVVPGHSTGAGVRRSLPGDPDGGGRIHRSVQQAGWRGRSTEILEARRARGVGSPRGRAQEERVATRTKSFGVGKRESHDASEFYARNLASIVESRERDVGCAATVNRIFDQSSEHMTQLPDNSVSLMVTSPPYHVGKTYDAETSFEDYLHLLHQVFAETYRVLQPGGRAVVNVANLGRRPYVPLSHLVTDIMHSIGYFMRAEIIWRKAKGAAGNCAWGSWRSPANPVIRDVHEYCLCFSKGRFDRVVKGQSTIDAEEFMDATLSVWDIPPESASRVGHPAPFPVALPRRFIELYTFERELVLDPFMGSGSTAVAAVQSGRAYIGYETDSAYVGAARERVDAAKLELGSHAGNVVTGDGTATPR
ncbi:MAG: site-specific DNA-methyltransferase, partial [Actinobacteria bacterium]|nr:site-specific DNA-methyltransferase [Actinomycetota bacterium]